VHSATQLTVQLNPMGPSQQQYEHAMRYVLSPVTLRSALVMKSYFDMLLFVCRYMRHEQEFLNEAFWNGPRGPEPATPEMMAQLPANTVLDEHCALSSCTICQDAVQKGDILSQLPCQHGFHRGCLLQWLQLHNSCPLCRASLQTPSK